MLWKRRRFLTTSGWPIENGKPVAKLLDAIVLLSGLDIIKVSVLSKSDTAKAIGNSG